MDFKIIKYPNLIINEDELVCVIIGHIWVEKSILYNKLCNNNW